MNDFLKGDTIHVFGSYVRKSLTGFYIRIENDLLVMVQKQRNTINHNIVRLGARHYRTATCRFVLIEKNNYGKLYVR